MNRQQSITPGSLRSGVLTLPIGKQTDWLRIATIVRVEAEGNYSRIYVSGGNSYVLAVHLSKLTKRLPGFWRLHRSHLVNPDFAERLLIREGVLKLKTGERLPVARRRRGIVFVHLSEYLAK